MLVRNLSKALPVIIVIPRNAASKVFLHFISFPPLNHNLIYIVIILC